MINPLQTQMAELLAKPGTIASIATLNESGAPHSVPAPFLCLDESGRVVHLELLETSTTHRNLLGSIWFERPVSITLSGQNGEVLVLSARPCKALVSGPLFCTYYREVRSILGDADLAAVWLLEALQIRDETYLTCKAQEEALHPFYSHLDRLVIRK